MDPAAGSPSPGHAGSPFGPLEPRPARAAGPPTPRSLAATFDLVAETPGDARGDTGKEGSRGVRISGPGETFVGRARHGGSSAAEEQRTGGGTRSNPHFIDSRGGSSRGGQTSTSSGTDSDCRVVESGSRGSGVAESPTVWLPAGGEATAASLQGVPLDILRQVSPAQRRACAAHAALCWPCHQPGPIRPACASSSFVCDAVWAVLQVAAKQQRREEDNGAAAVAQRRRRRMLAQLPGLVNLLR